MLFTKNYYTVLNLPQAQATDLTQSTLRKAYKTALLSAHPDKKSPNPLPTGDGGDGKYTVDDVKEALAVLSDPARRAELDKWLSTQRAGEREGEGQEDFVLGLELLDLSDFEAGVGGMAGFVRMATPEGDEDEDGEEVGIDFDDLKPPSPSGFVAASEEGTLGGGDVTTLDGGEVPSTAASASASPRTSQTSEAERPGEADGEMEWTRACRCGAEKGFRIRECELEDAEARGESEVLVGCVGCSLWVRVGFDVEEG